MLTVANHDVKHNTEPIRDNMRMDTMADRIKTLRLAHGMTQEQLGKRVGVSKVAVSLWESAQVENIKLATFLKLCEVLHTSPHFLLFGPDSIPGRDRLRN